MGLFDFVGKTFNQQNDYNAQQANTTNTNYQTGQTLANAQQFQGNNNGNIAAQQALAQQIQAQGAPTAGQTQLTNSLTAQAAGQGPSLAQGQLASATNQNASQAASQAASSRGLNPAMQARMSGENQAMLNQQAAGQSAQIRSGEQMNAQQALGQQLNAQQQQRLGASQTAGGVLQGVGSQNLNQQQTANQLLGTTSGAQNSQNNAAIANLGMQQGINSQVAQNNVNANNATTGSFLGAVGNIGASMLNFDEGGSVPQLSSNSGVDLSGLAKPFVTAMSSLHNDAAGPEGGKTSVDAKGDTTGSGGPSMGSSGGGAGAGAGASGASSALGGSAGAGDLIGEAAPLMALAAQGGYIPGQASVRGNSLRNDTVPAMLSPGEIVLPRSVTQSNDPAGHAASFVAAIKAKNQAQTSYADVIAAQKQLHERLARLESAS